MSLYAIKSEMESILDAILEGGVDSPEAQDALNAHLEGLDAALEDKADDYAGLVRSLELRRDARKAEAKRIAQLAEADDALADRLKERLKAAMEASGKTKLDTARFKLSVAGNGGKAPLEVTADAASLPPEFQTVSVTFNRDAISTALEGGAVIPGCTILPRGTSLRIR